MVYRSINEYWFSIIMTFTWPLQQGNFSKKYQAILNLCCCIFILKFKLSYLLFFPVYEIRHSKCLKLAKWTKKAISVVIICLRIVLNIFKLNLYCIKTGNCNKLNFTQIAFISHHEMIFIHKLKIKAGKSNPFTIYTAFLDLIPNYVLHILTKFQFCMWFLLWFCYMKMKNNMCQG